MKKRRFYIKGQKDRSFSVGTLVSLSREDSHYLKRVLRIGRGVSISLFDGGGREMEAVVHSLTPQTVSVRVTRVKEIGDDSASVSESRSRDDLVNGEPCSAFSKFSIELALPLLKADKLESALRMASQMGANGFLVFLSERCVPQPGCPGVIGKMKRWGKIILDSIRISGRSLAPSLFYCDSLESALKTVSKKKKIIFAHEQPGALLLSRVLSQMLPESLRGGLFPDAAPANLGVENAAAFDGFVLVTGPEGGFSKEEVEMAVRYGAIICSLGQGVLKAETAPIAALSVILSFLGRL